MLAHELNGILPGVTGLPGIHIETKRAETLNDSKAIAQAVADAGDKLPVVLHRARARSTLPTTKSLMTSSTTIVPELL